MFPHFIGKCINFPEQPLSDNSSFKFCRTGKCYEENSQHNYSSSSPLQYQSSFNKNQGASTGTCTQLMNAIICYVSIHQLYCQQMDTQITGKFMITSVDARHLGVSLSEQQNTTQMGNIDHSQYTLHHNSESIVVQIYGIRTTDI